MSLYHTLQATRRLASIFEMDSPVIAMGAATIPHFQGIVAMAGVVAETGAAQDRLANLIDLAIREIREYRPRAVFRDFHNLRQRIASLALVSASPEDEVSVSILDLLEAAEDAYDNLVNSHFSRARSVEFFERLTRLYTDIRAKRDLITISSPRTDTDWDNDFGRIEIFVDSDQTSAEIRQKLQALEDMYSALADALDVDEDRYPLKILNLAVGTWWVEAAGELGIIRFLRRILVEPINNTRNAVTREGKAKSIPQKLDTVRLFLELSDEMEKRGLDASELRMKAQMAAERLADSYTSLVADEKYLEVDGEGVRVAPAGAPQIIPAKPEPKRLGPGRTP